MIDQLTYCQELALKSRIEVLHMMHRANASHIGSCFSMLDILAVLYGEILNIDPKNPYLPDRDRFILSKGHGTAALYAILSERGFFPLDWLQSYYQNGSELIGHTNSKGIPGVEVSTGSLGHGLPIGCGLALAAKRDQLSYRVYVLLSDGELDEGSNWEAILFAPQHLLDNLVVIIDYNKIQGFGTVKEVLDLDPLYDKWKAFRWGVREINGHDYKQIEESLKRTPFEPGLPSVIIAHTIKGKGVSFMENRLEWHYKSPNDEQLAQALAELKVAKEK
jgi:transketolase